MTSGEARFGEIYEEYFKLVHAYCRRRTSTERANDAVAEVFLIAWRRIEDVPLASDALPWLYGVARGVVSNTRRSSFRAWRLDKRMLALGPPRADSPAEVIVSRHETAQVLNALNDLGPGDQEVLRLSIWEELSGSELAIALGVSEQAARQRLSRARKRLADSYNRREGSTESRQDAVEEGAQ